MPRTKTKPELENELAAARAELAALKATLNGRFYKLDDKPALSFPLSREQLAIVAEYVDRTVSNLAGEGKRLAEFSTEDTSHFDLAFGWGWGDALLPEFDGLLARYSCNSEDGTHAYSIWGLRIINTN